MYKKESTRVPGDRSFTWPKVPFPPLVSHLFRSFPILDFLFSFSASCNSIRPPGVGDQEPVVASHRQYPELPALGDGTPGTS